MNSLISDHSFMTNLRFPWNQNCLTGWMADTVIYISLIVSYTLVNPAFLTLFISFCEYHRAFYEIFQSQFDKINKLSQETKLFHNNGIKEAVYKTILSYFCKTVINQIFFKKNWLKTQTFCRLFRQTAHVYSKFILIQVVCTTVLLSCCVFQMDLVMPYKNIL